MSSQDLVDLLAERAIWRNRDIRANRINHRTIQRALDEGVLKRPVMVSDLGPLPGILVSADADIDPDFDDALAMVLVPGGVIARCTAAMRQDLGRDLARSIEVLTRQEVAHVPRQANLHLMRSRREGALTEGVESRMTALGVEVRMTNPARTVVDLFRSAHKVPGHVATANAALAAFIAGGGRGGDVVRLSRLFEESIQTGIETAVNAATEALTKGYAA